MTKQEKNGFLFIINPKAGNGSASKCQHLIRKMCSKRKLRYTIKETKAPGEASDIARKGLECGFEAIVAVGGDGTVNEVGRELVSQNIPLGIIPAGSGNGLARHMKIPMNKRRAIKRIFKGRTKLIDTGTIDGHRFLNMAGIGFDAHVSKAFAQSKGRGFYNYARIILKMCSNIKRLKLKITCEDYSAENEVIMLSLANSSQFGNNAKIAPKADIADGKVDVCILKPLGIFSALFFLIKVMTSTVRKNSVFETFKTSKLQIDNTDGLAHVDGDPIQIGKNVQVEMLHQSLKIIY